MHIQPLLLLLYGGESNEREISLISGSNVEKALQTLNYQYIKADPIKDNIEEIIINNPQITGVINMLHGGWGEGGGAQALCEKYSLPHSSSNSHSCQIFLNKVSGLEEAKKVGLNIAQSNLYTLSEYKNADILFPHIVKPTHEGSTLNIMKIADQEDKEKYIYQWSLNNTNDQPRLVEKFIDGLEYSIAFIDNKIFGGVNVEFSSIIYDYKTKYFSKNVFKHTLEKPEYEQSYKIIKEKGLELYKSLNCTSFVRMDFVIEKTTKIPFFLEGNATPGMTYTSILPDIALLVNNMNFDQLVEYIVQNLAYSIVTC